MGLLDFLRKKKEPAFGLPELARRLGMSEADLAAVEVRYHEFTIPKRRGGGRRTILAPDRPLKRLQRRILRRLLALLVSHPAVHGFERGRSIVTNARFHLARPIVVRLDIRDFFTSTSAQRVERFFRRIGWDKPAARRLTELCTYQGGLPQGAPTSPRLANLVNYRLDTRLDHLAVRMGAMYTRYADDLTFSFDEDRGGRVRALIRATGRIVAGEGYRLHTRRKLSIRRRHQQQRVTGLVVNERINLPRETRRRLRAVAHHLAAGRKATLTEDQMRGWGALMSMVRCQAGPPDAP
jgi:retron-type reverse transcriptase